MAATDDSGWLRSEFFTSWMAAARGDADKQARDFTERSAAWAHWMLQQTAHMTGANERSYPAVVLEGKFHDPKGTGPLVRPHLEIPEKVLRTADRTFPKRLAAAGNGLLFPWWLLHEVTAVKRSLFGGVGDAAEEFIDAAVEDMPTIVAHFNAISRLVVARWSEVEELMFTVDDGLSTAATGSFGMAEAAEVLPMARDLHLRVDYDQKLAERSGSWASRRMGVWQVSGVSPSGDRFCIGAVTPRLTANSQFVDELFAPLSESPVALLVRTLVLRRIARDHLDIDPASGDVVIPRRPPSFDGAHLRARSAKVGEKLPEASTKAAVGFLQAFPDADDAWMILERWAADNSVLLTVTADGFKASHRRASRFLRRAEDPDRDDINVVLPIGWADSKVVRVSFSKNRKVN